VGVAPGRLGIDAHAARTIEIAISISVLRMVVKTRLAQKLPGSSKCILSLYIPGCGVFFEASRSGTFAASPMMTIPP
jgi:hypothetical protein